jgi:hypothetical protein
MTRGDQPARISLSLIVATMFAVTLGPLYVQAFVLHVFCSLLRRFFCSLASLSSSLLLDESRSSADRFDSITEM